MILLRTEVSNEYERRQDLLRIKSQVLHFDAVNNDYRFVFSLTGKVV